MAKGGPGSPYGRFERQSMERCKLLETLNRNGHRLLDLCAVNELVIINTFCQHKEIHKFTWKTKEGD